MKIRLTTKKQSFNIYVLKANAFIDYLKEKTDALNLEIEYTKKSSQPELFILLEFMKLNLIQALIFQ